MRNLGLSLLVFCLLSAAPPVSGQTPGDPSRLTGAPSAIYDLADFGKVDLTNGNLQLQIPLLRLPGRGIDTDLIMSYNSKLWMTGQSLPDPSLPPQANTATDPSVPSSPVFGWSVGQKRFGGAVGWNSITCLDSPDCNLFESYVEWVAPEGVRTALSSGQGCCWSPPSTGFFYSFDGSYAMSETLATVVFKDGVKVTSSSLEDTNGNQITKGVNSSTQSYIKDTLGRMIYFNYNTSGVLQSITYLDSTGVNRSISFSYTTQTLNMPYISTSNCLSTVQKTSNVSLLNTVTLANGRTFQFQYLMNSDGTTTGEIAKVSLPTGGYIRYNYGFGQITVDPTLTCFPSNAMGQDRMVTARIVSSDGTTASEQTWTYAFTVSGDNSTLSMTVTDPVGNKRVTSSLHGYGVVTEEDYKDSTGTLIKSVKYANQCNDSTAFFPYLPYGLENVCVDPQVLSQTTVLADANQQSKQTYIYGNYNNVVEEDEYDWGPGSPGALVRKTTYAYLNDSNSAYTTDAVHILNRKTSATVYDSGGCARKQTTFSYDGTSPTATSGVVQHDYTGFPATYNLRGNLTQTNQWLGSGTTSGSCSTTGSWLNAGNSYNDVGDLTQTTDPLGLITSFSYADNFYNFTPASPTLAFVTQTTLPVTNGVNHVQKRQYYFNSGLVAANCGQNFAGAACNFGLAAPQSDYATYTYDLLNRRLVLSLGDGGQNALSYNETSTPITISSTTKINSTINLITTTVFDGLGRAAQTQLTSDPQGTTYTDTTYDALGRVSTVSNPYRSTSDSTYGITTTQYDGLGRTARVIPPDGSASADFVSASYLGNTTTVIDEAGKSRKSVTDSLGRLISVFEDPSGLNYETDYTYDILNNLLTVNQKGGSANSANWRTRTFTYDSLSRLLCTSNPESSSAPCPGTSTYTSGTTGYAYDVDGNLSTKTTPAPNQTGTATVTTSYSYDALNRLTRKSYNDSGATPTVQYGYDAVALSGCATAPPSLTDSNPRGQRTAMCDGAGAESWSHDTTGRVLTDSRTTNNVTKSTIYTYLPYVDGSINTITYPSGRIFTYSTSSAQRLLSVQDNSTSVYYASGALYAPPGAPSSIKNGPNLYSTHIFDKRLQLCWLYTTTGTPLASNAACTGTSTTGNILDLKYSFNLGASDNGNITAITNNRDTTRSQTSSYDSLNRIATAETTSTHATSPANCWGESYFYDNLTTAGGAWGNLTTISSPSSAYTGCSGEALSVTALTNNRLNGFGYDSPGNLNSGSGTSGISFNAENQLITAAGFNFKYDGDGKRVFDSTGTLYWYGAGSDPLDETDLSGNFANEYVFFGDQRIARRDPSNNVFYYFADHLGTARTIAEVASGQSTATLCYDADFYPFGGERAPIVNTCPQNYKFTGKRSDPESGLDNFGARYDSFSLGRFMSVDWSDDADPIPYADATNPQTLNLYSYTGDNPMNRRDADGHDDDPAAAGKCAGWLCRFFRALFSAYSPSNPVMTSSSTRNEMNAPFSGPAGTTLTNRDVIRGTDEMLGAYGRALQLQNQLLDPTGYYANGVGCATGLQSCSDLGFGIALTLIPGLAELKLLPAIPQAEKNAIAGVLRQIASGATKGKPYFNITADLPVKAAGYYREYTVPLSGILGRGQARIITGAGGEIYYTAHHFAWLSFIRIR